MNRVGKVECCGRVDGNAFLDKATLIVIGEFAIGNGVKVDFVNTHLVLRECTRLVGTDNGGSAHRLASVHFAHEIVGAEHTTHTIGQTQCDGHRKSFGYGYHDERHGYHERL